MTTIITRLYPDLATAKTVVAALESGGHDASTIDLITKSGDGPVEARMSAARVRAPSAAAYAPGIDKGGALVVVRAPFSPIGTARNAIKVVNRTPALDVGLADEDVYIREEPRIYTAGKVLPGTTFFMSNPFRVTKHGHVLGQNPIIAAKPRTSAIAGGAYMSTKFWPMKLISAPKERTSAIRGGFLFSSIFGIPTVVREWGPREMMTTI
jgi:hypothetical protein